MVKDILSFVLEADEDESFYKDVFAPEDREYSLEEIKERCPKFFGRENNRFFGTKKRYKYPGNYVVLKNVRTMPGHGMFALPRRETSWVIYKFKRTQDTPDGDLFFVAHARDLQDARWMIKHQDFRDWKHRAAGLAEADEDEFKEVYYAGQPLWSYVLMPEDDAGYHRAYYTLRGLKRAAFTERRDLEEVKREAEHWVVRFNSLEPIHPYGVNDGSPWDWYRKWRGVGESEEDDFKEVYTGASMLRDVGVFRVFTEGGKFFLATTEPNVHPRQTELSREDANYLIHLSDSEFQHAAVLDFGVGVFAGEEEPDDAD